MIKPNLVTIELNKLALLLQEKDELIESQNNYCV